MTVLFTGKGYKRSEDEDEHMRQWFGWTDFFTSTHARRFHTTIIGGFTLGCLILLALDMIAKPVDYVFPVFVWLICFCIHCAANIIVLLTYRPRR